MAASLGDAASLRSDSRFSLGPPPHCDGTAPQIASMYRKRSEFDRNRYIDA
jgi:hypothetical protein